VASISVLANITWIYSEKHADKHTIGRVVTAMQFVLGSFSKYRTSMEFSEQFFSHTRGLPFPENHLSGL
jgi:hypothetical protein